MSHPTYCPNWEYKDHAGHDEVLSKRAEQTLVLLYPAASNSEGQILKDSRRLHGAFFQDLTPPGFDYYAGHYRGESFSCLREYEVGVGRNPTLGHPAATVPMEMASFALDLGRALSSLDWLWRVSDATFPRAAKLRRTAEVAASLISIFMHIHPYANGNGHIGRFIGIFVFARYGFKLRRWGFHPRPAPPYSEVIALHQEGVEEPLVSYLLDCL